MVERYAEVSVEGTRKVQCRITEPTGKERARQILVFLTTVGAIAAACMILAGVSQLSFLSTCHCFQNQISVDFVPANPEGIFDFIMWIL